MAENPSAALNFLRTRRRGVTEQFGVSEAEYARNMGQLNLAGQRGRRDLNLAFGQERRGLPGGFMGRGLLRSGIYGRALTDLGVSQTNRMGDLNDQMASQTAELMAGRQAAIRQRSLQLEDISNQEALARSGLAMQPLMDFRPTIPGLGTEV